MYVYENEIASFNSVTLNVYMPLYLNNKSCFYYLKATYFLTDLEIILSVAFAL